MRIAIIGFGGVGKAFLGLLKNKKEELNKEGIEPKVIYVISSKGGVYDQSGIDIEKFLEYSNKNNDIANYPFGGSKDVLFESIIENKDVDYVIEMTHTNLQNAEPGMTHIKKSLECGINVITANKGPVVLYYKKLKEIAIKNNVQLGIGCTTGGALPSVNGGLIEMAGSKITSIEGVLNGTTNFILNEMENNDIEYSDALKKAQSLGIAETNPTLDVDGWDTATKLLILTNVLMNEEKILDEVNVEGIRSVTLSDIKEALYEGKKYKLIGRTIKSENNLEVSVKLEKIGPESPLYGVDGKNKAVRYISDTLGDLTLIGGASGTTPAAASILRDLININRGYNYLL